MESYTDNGITNIGLQTLYCEFSLTAPHRKLSNGVKSQVPGGHLISTFRSIKQSLTAPRRKLTNGVKSQVLGGQLISTFRSIKQSLNV